MKRTTLFLALSMSLALANLSFSDEAAKAPELAIQWDISETPEHIAWANRAQKLMVEWHPKISALLESPDFTPPHQLSLKIEKSDKGVAYCAGTSIVVSSHWIEKHPGDIGLAVHELVHVIQRYPNPNPIWITEGIADYIRFAVFEKMPLNKFPVSNKPDAYKGGYRVAAGFLLWLESEKSPGIVKKLNAAMRKKIYTDAMFKEITGLQISDAWKAYVKARSKK